jgi:hypothetical protein
LLTEPAFLEEAARLTDQWLALSASERPLFPFARYPAPTINADMNGPRALGSFYTELGNFLDRWSLTAMTTWDLPSPQGPLIPTGLPMDATAMPVHGVHLVLPLHYPLQGDDDLLNQILQSQRKQARDLGIDESLAGLRHYRAYSRMYDVLHLERSILSRMPGAVAPYGFRLRIYQAIAEGLHLSVEAVQKYRQAIVACRKGQRSRVSRLLTTTR